MRKMMRKMMRKIASVRNMMRKMVVMHKIMCKTMRKIAFMRKMISKIAFMCKMMRKIKYRHPKANIADRNCTRDSDFIHWHKTFIACRIKSLLFRIGPTTTLNANLGPFPVFTDEHPLSY